MYCVWYVLNNNFSALSFMFLQIGNDSELANIITLVRNNIHCLSMQILNHPPPFPCTQPPAVAATTLEGVVGAREEVDETVVAYLLGDVVSRSKLPARGVGDSFSEVSIFQYQSGCLHFYLTLTLTNLLQTIFSIGDIVLEETSNNEEVTASFLSFRIPNMHTQTHAIPYTAQCHRWQFSDCYHREVSFQRIQYIL